MANAYVSCNSNGEAAPDSDSLKPTVLTSSASFRSRKKPASISRAGSEVDDFITLLHGSDPVRVELNRLDNEVRDKDRELGDAHAEIKALKYSERLKEKAVEEVLSLSLLMSAFFAILFLESANNVASMCGWR
ncbi:hypothetical protein U1Q18_013767 [Sarracenia purpurea var. burkii]